MNLVDRYLKAVAKALPEKQREDIIRELSEDIRSEMEDKQGELGRLLTEAEQQAFLKQRGNPLLLAARYHQDDRRVAFGRQLIGPVLYPFYIKVLSFNLGLTIVVVGTIFLALGVSGQRIRFNDILSSCLLQLFIQLGVVTLIFSLIEKHLTKNPDRWNLSGKCGGVQLWKKRQLTYRALATDFAVRVGVHHYRFRRCARLDDGSSKLPVPNPGPCGGISEARAHLVRGVLPDRAADSGGNRARDH